MREKPKPVVLDYSPPVASPRGGALFRVMSMCGVLFGWVWLAVPCEQAWLFAVFFSAWGAILALLGLLRRPLGADRYVLAAGILLGASALVLAVLGRLLTSCRP